ncbi:MAG: isoamylase early set domain-containing protein [Desulfobacterales bacterium]|nr:isoamylase early set domain-containing protein [Desulfobacterales bacterium]
MAIKKQYFKTKSQCKVTFRVQKEMGNGAKEIHVVGEFNQWDKGATPMKSYKNGTFAATVDLDPNKKYQFRYLADGVNWLNDTDADAYIHSPYGNCDNSVIVT